MAKADISRRRHQAPMADMNVVPLVDVMLVLIVIFIVTGLFCCCDRGLRQFAAVRSCWG